MAAPVREVVWTARAQAALRSELRWLARRSYPAAERLLERSLTAAASLDRFAERGRVIPEAARESMREIFVGKYRLMYEVSTRHVRIIAFVHGARNFSQLLRRWKILGRSG